MIAIRVARVVRPTLARHASLHLKTRAPLLTHRAQACCVRAARGAATVRAKNGAVREELRAAQSAPPL